MLNRHDSQENGPVTRVVSHGGANRLITDSVGPKSRLQHLQVDPFRSGFEGQDHSNGGREKSRIKPRKLWTDQRGVGSAQQARPDRGIAVLTSSSASLLGAGARSSVPTTLLAGLTGDNDAREGTSQQFAAESRGKPQERGGTAMNTSRSVEKLCSWSACHKRAPCAVSRLSSFSMPRWHGGASQSRRSRHFPLRCGLFPRRTVPQGRGSPMSAAPSQDQHLFGYEKYRHKSRLS